MIEIEIDCPYDDIILLKALKSLDTKLTDASIGKRVGDRLDDLYMDSEDKAALNKKIAEYNGISVLDLINSPNYETLSQEFYTSLFYKAIKILKEESFTNEEAWATLCLGSGLLKI